MFEKVVNDEPTSHLAAGPALAYHMGVITYKCEIATLTVLYVPDVWPAPSERVTTFWWHEILAGWMSAVTQ